MHHGRWRTGRETLEEAKVQLALTVAEAAGAGAVCDIGCGYGALARLLAERGARVLAFTNSRRQFDHCSRTSGGIAYRLGDWLAEAQPPEPAAFDALVALESFEHFAEKAAFFRQARRWLRRGGKLVLSGWQAGRAAPVLDRICRTAQMPPLLTGAECQALAEAAGFTLVRAEDLTRAVRRTWPRMALALARRPRLWRYAWRHWRFALAALRITVAFHTGALRYALIILRAR